MLRSLRTSRDPTRTRVAPIRGRARVRTRTPAAARARRARCREARSHPTAHHTQARNAPPTTVPRRMVRRLRSFPATRFRNRVHTVLHIRTTLHPIPILLGRVITRVIARVTMARRIVMGAISHRRTSSPRRRRTSSHPRTRLRERVALSYFRGGGGRRRLSIIECGWEFGKGMGRLILRWTGRRGVTRCTATYTTSPRAFQRRGCKRADGGSPFVRVLCFLHVRRALSPTSTRCVVMHLGSWTDVCSFWIVRDTGLLNTRDFHVDVRPSR
ncbi:hypothetical protein C8R43DRAFT_1039926 [Mycena crocata]|nr:hypothetical protein C8R43DRAFT_1039926 [Mycena crocata]